MRWLAPFCAPIAHGCLCVSCVVWVAQVEASEAEVKEWKARFCPRKEDDINWATGSVRTLVPSSMS